MTSTSRACSASSPSDDSFSADLSAFQNIGTATYDESALPENDAVNPEDQLGGQAL